MPEDHHAAALHPAVLPRVVLPGLAAPPRDLLWGYQASLKVEKAQANTASGLDSLVGVVRQ